MARKTRTVAEEIAKELSKPVFKDVDIENEPDSSSEGSDEEVSREHYVQNRSRLRGVELGENYRGKKVSRGDLYDGDEAQSEGSESEEAESNDSDILADVTDSENEEDTHNSDESEASEEGEGDQESENDDSDASSVADSYKRERLSQLLAEEKKQIISRLSATAKSDAIKGYAILSQHRIFDLILDSRIKLQKAIVSANQLPLNTEIYDSLSKKEKKEVEKVQDKVLELLGKTISVRRRLYAKDKIEAPAASTNKRSLASLYEETNEFDSVLEPFKKNVLVKWSAKVQAASGSSALQSGKFQTINQDAYSQVQSNLQDMERLVKRTKLNRRGVTPLGMEKDQEPILFDDDDFYRVLLNDMVDKKISDKAASSAAIVTMSSNRIHKNYDRRATKGRKLKYTVQEPLQQFEVPKKSGWAWNDDQIDEFFASLLGRKIDMGEEAEENEPEEGEAILKSDLKLFG
ncbi:hypothetical protein KL929_002658 [Ogataea haglerorum]|uniref:Protein BFR2 n=1 Tax=Ogataea haglerorum TaxID=1937702 RepID=A0ABQ7RFM2_9ASCO|nr:uncharacterized protein KL911_004666 [Ogataea haglerorum]KAG7698363.1 hypothetical protein KL951_001627 [Ogataea haglerorum]KAG7729035.1 hypothetical protein KL948_004072 [Ogataea haglerorum]KAG7738101.1 hypothetical protein KL923_003648 [Ogataea haglerorum]KAG7750787.1 hypothetical protein KL911_004666 [Ogataea haglerorum]KAG7758177.1 hypothetical protein KL947_002556 [Ogataea haglerorum]